MTGLIVDLFAGGGGASTGLEMALGRSPDIAINHDAEALAMHAANHPHTLHLQNDITRVLPLEATGGRPVAVLHASPDCTHFSKAKGAKPKSQYIRDLAWVVIRWAEDTRPMLITLENVEEFLTWGPLDAEGHPIKAHAGDTFRAWGNRLRRLGYLVDWRLLRACDYGAPTTRKRLFVVARRDKRPIVWPKPTHGNPKSDAVLAGELLPWRTAAECIDWSLQSQSIFDRKKPLALNTQRRIAEGLRRYVLASPEPFVVTYYGSKSATDFRGQDLHRPLPTQTTENRFGLVSPVVAGAIVHPNHTATDYTPFRGQDINEPLRVITQSPGFALAEARMEAACIAKHYSGVTGHDMERPLGTVTTVDHHSLVTANMIKLRGANVGAPADEPLRTVSAQGQHHALMTATLIGAGGPSYAGEPVPPDRPLGTILSKHSRALVTACINKHFGCSVGHDLPEPLHTVTGHAKHSLTSACMVKYYGNDKCGVCVSDPMHTITGKDRMGLVSTPLGQFAGRYEQVRDWLRHWNVIGPGDEAEMTVGGVVYRLMDICMRMLAPRELYTAQGIRADYSIDPVHNGKRLSKTAQVRMCGNSVPPQFVAALVRVNGPETWAVRPEAERPLMRAVGL